MCATWRAPIDEVDEALTQRCFVTVPPTLTLGTEISRFGAGL